MSSYKRALMAAALPAMYLFAPSAYAETAEASEGATAAQSATNAESDIIVTGTARAQRRFDASYSINLLTSAEIDKIAPVNMADLIGQLPGFQTESTGGEVQNIYRIRGLPSDGGFVNFQQDGLPLYHENDGYFFRGDSIARYDLMVDRMEVLRGGPASVYASYAGAIINNITVTGSDTPRGKAQVTLGDSGLYRLDAYQAGPLGQDTYYAIGGFLRYNEGLRDNGFPTDKGGQIRANIKRNLDNGFVKVTANYVNDHNVFYLPIPIKDPRDPSVSLDPFIDYFSGTMNTPALRNVTIKYLDGAGTTQTQESDLANGRHTKAWNIGLQYENDFNGWLLSAKTGLTRGRVHFNALYSTANPSDANAYANGFLSKAQAAFGSDVTRLGYALAGTGGANLYDPYADSGLVMPGQYRDISTEFYSAQGDLSVTRKFETGLGSHDIRTGVYASAYGGTLNGAYQDYLIQVKSQPELLDLIAYDSMGAIKGSVTDNGVLYYASTLKKGDADGTVIALYGNDTWQVTRSLRVDAGIRHESYDYKGWGALTSQQNQGDPNTLADDTSRGFTGSLVHHDLSYEATNWTAGVNYDLSPNFGVYGRMSHLESVPSVQQVSNVDPSTVVTKANQNEIGFKFAKGGSYLYVTGFFTKFKPMDQSFTAYNPATGRNDERVPFVGEATVKGVEFDGLWRVTPWFSLTGALTVSDPKYHNFQNTDGADPSLVEGNQIVRQPRVYGNIRPSFNFTAGSADVQVYGRYNYMGRRYVDLYNNTALPAYSTFGAGVTVNYGTWQIQLVGDNLTNAHGLTEGNSRTDNLAGQGSVEAIYGRPIYGRNFRIVIGTSW